MASQLKESRKSMSFLSPQVDTQSRKQIRSSHLRLSLSSQSGKVEQFLGTLMNDPVKRQLLFEVLSQDNAKAIVNDKNPESNRSTPIKKIQKYRMESPSALYRRRALQKMQNGTVNYKDNKKDNVNKIPFEKILKGVIAYVEVKSNDEDRSAGAKALMQAMGAEIRNVLNREITHVIFKDGTFKTYQKAKLLKAHLVSLLWLEAVRKNKRRVPEVDYPALGSKPSNANISLLCQQFQEEYADVLQEELSRNTKTATLDNLSDDDDDVIDTSQNFDIGSVIRFSDKSSSGRLSPTPSSLRLEDTPSITSDSESDLNVPNNGQKTPLKQIENVENINNTSLPDKKIRKTSLLNLSKCRLLEDICVNLNSSVNKTSTNTDVSSEKTNSEAGVEKRKSNRQSTQSEELSSLRISADSVNVVDQSDNDLTRKNTTFKNVTVRKKTKIKTPVDNNENVFVHADKLQENLNTNDNSREDLECSKQTKQRTKAVRRLYNSNNIDVLDESDSNDHSSDEFVKPDVIFKEKLNKTFDETNFKTPKKTALISNAKVSTTIPRRKSVRLSSLKCINDDICDARVSSTIPKRKSTKLNSLKSLDDDISNAVSKPTPRKTLRRTLNFEKKPKELSASRKSLRTENKSTKSSDEFQPESDNELSKNPKQKSNNNPSPKRKSKYIENGISVNISTNKLSPTKKSRRSSLEFIPKESLIVQNKLRKGETDVVSKVKSTQNKTIKKTSIVCTRFHSTEVQVFQQIVKKLGVFFVEDEVTEKTTHLVAAEPRRTINLLRAMARGCWILKSEWLYRSLEENRWLPEEDYELTEFSSVVQQARQQRQAFGSRFTMDIFSTCGRIYISKSTNPRCSDLQELVTLCKGTVTTLVRNADIIVGEYIHDKKCVTVTWILDCITFYKKKSLTKYLMDVPSTP